MALFAQHPTDGVYYVGFAAAVWTNDAGGAVAAKGDHGPFAEGLKANNFDFSELKQGFPFCRELPLRDALPRKLRLLQAVKGPGVYRAKRDDFPFLEGRFFYATFLPLTDRNHTRLAGSVSEPSRLALRMAVREKSVARVMEAVKYHAMDCVHFSTATIGVICDW